MSTDPGMKGSDEQASSPFIWPPVIYALAALGAGFLAWQIPWSILPPGFTGFILRLLGGAVIVSGVAVALAAERRFKAVGTPVPPTKPTTAIVTEGIYARTRNPMYLGLTLVLIGLGLLFGSLWFLIAAPFAVFCVTKLAIEREERYLSAKFGDDYHSYKARVRRWL